MVQALWDAGVPREVLHVVHVKESDLGTRLVSDERVGRLILTGAFDTAQLFRRFRPDLPLLAETSGKNAIVITGGAVQISGNFTPEEAISVAMQLRAGSLPGHLTFIEQQVIQPAAKP